MEFDHLCTLLTKAKSFLSKQKMSTMVMVMVMVMEMVMMKRSDKQNKLISSLGLCYFGPAMLEFK